MLIALKSVFSSLHTQSHCPIITLPPYHTDCVSVFSARMPHYWHMQGKCMRACAHMGENVCLVLLPGCLSMHIDLATCHLHFALNLLCGNAGLSAACLT